MIEPRRSTQNYLSRIRGIPILPQERVARIFSVQEGLLDEPIGSGSLLIATNRRVLFFDNQRGYDEASLFPLEELKSVVVSSSVRKSRPWLAGLLTIALATLFYLVVSYWLTARFDTAYIPILNMDILPMLVMAVIVLVAWLFWRHEVHRPGVTLTLQGANWNLSFAYLGTQRIPEVNQVVETLFLCREERIASL